MPDPSLDPSDPRGPGDDPLPGPDRPADGGPSPDDGARAAVDGDVPDGDPTVPATATGGGSGTGGSADDASPAAAPRRAVPGAQPPSLTEAVGGPLGIAESAVPAALFVAVYTLAGKDATVAAIVAVVVGASLTIARVIKGQTLQFALSGLFGIALAGFIVSRTGNASDYFLPGILINIGYAAAYVVSIVVRWPIMGLLIGSLSGEPTAWRKDPAMVRTYTLVTWIWVGLFVLRLSVQLPLYLADSLVALGVARVSMGIPIFVLGLWLTYLVVQRATAAAATKDPPATA